MKMMRLLMMSLLSAGVFASAACSSSQPTDDESVSEQPATEESAPEEGVQGGEMEHAEGDDHGAMAEEPAEDGELMEATARVINGEGEEIGQVMFKEVAGGGVQVSGMVSGLTPGLHGFHVHENTVCEAPDFTSAGGHFNPGSHEHGGPANEHTARHAGDFGNITANEEGVAEFSFVDTMISLSEGENNVAGQAMIVHEGEDDLVSQPTGAAGARAGCAVITLVE
ncbi:superoxide dismutase family protein [Lujinxingia vulgaris]|uniref:Superoxide dismutase family protein n=1 Tax=Lujinxingia vulgaris TaxID=2600176 RepID=A0A5C6XDJ1_9DELT|nr:superoxide dismutase family protein [Lujinxingia vulgaris]TXD41213.1 superoxide dismutase family protein [Lujinxingia vulgaris]